MPQIKRALPTSTIDLLQGLSDDKRRLRVVLRKLVEEIKNGRGTSKAPDLVIREGERVLRDTEPKK